MAIFAIKENRSAITALLSSLLFVIAATIFFIPVDMAHKIAIPVGILTIASLWLCPWQITLALAFSSAGDIMGSCGNIIAQMAFFAVGHIWFILYFIKRYKEKVEHDGKLTSKAKGYLIMVGFCSLVLLAAVILKIATSAPAGILRIGTIIYAAIICGMMFMALVQRSCLFAAGAMLFVFSDFILSWNMFIEPIPYGTYIVMITYYLAQWLLFIRSSKIKARKQIRLFRL